MKFARFITFSVVLTVILAAPASAQLHATRDRTIQQDRGYGFGCADHQRHDGALAVKIMTLQD